MYPCLGRTDAPRKAFSMALTTAHPLALCCPRFQPSAVYAPAGTSCALEALIAPAMQILPFLARSARHCRETPSVTARASPTAMARRQGTHVAPVCTLHPPPPPGATVSLDARPYAVTV